MNVGNQFIHSFLFTFMLARVCNWFYISVHIHFCVCMYRLMHHVYVCIKECVYTVTSIYSIYVYSYAVVWEACLGELVAGSGHDDGGYVVLHVHHVLGGKHGSNDQPAWLHAGGGRELQVCSTAPLRTQAAAAGLEQPEAAPHIAGSQGITKPISRVRGQETAARAVHHKGNEAGRTGIHGTIAMCSRGRQCEQLCPLPSVPDA